MGIAGKEKSSRYLAIAEQIKRSIGKKYYPGDMLTPERDLASQFSVSYMTMRKALDVLSQEGIIRRHQGRGTVIVDRLATGEFAIVLRPQLLEPEASPYYRIASRGLIDTLHDHNPRWKVKMHLGKVTKTGQEFPATLDLLEPDILKNLRGVFSFHPLYELEPKLQEAKVPVIMLGAKGGHYVWFDEKSLYEQEVSHLQEVGCKSIGFLWKTSPHTRPLDPNEQKDQIVSALVRSKGLECKPEWVSQYVGDITERSGYELFTRFWQQSHRPEGIIVEDDVLCRGVLRAIQQLGIKMPDQLRLITSANKQVDLPYHLPVTRVEFDVVEQARQASAMMVALLNGRTPERNAILLPGVLVKGATT